MIMVALNIFLAICRLIPTMEASQCCYKTTLQVYKF